MTSARQRRIASGIFTIFLTIFFFISFTFLTSCRPDGDSTGQAVGGDNAYEKESLYLFDYEKIKIEKTGSIDVVIKNCYLYLDIYQDLIILGEVENVSEVNKTDIEITIDFYGKSGDIITLARIPATVNYLRGGSRLPFCYYLMEREKYIDISSVKIGINYKDYYEKFKGNPIVEDESYYYEEDFLIIEGKVINLGERKIRNLKLFCTFFNDKNQVVFVKQCYLSREEMNYAQEQEFVLKVLLDEYLPEFTHYRFEVFFEDEIEVPV